MYSHFSPLLHGEVLDVALAKADPPDWPAVALAEGERWDSSWSAVSERGRAAAEVFWHWRKGAATRRNARRGSIQMKPRAAAGTLDVALKSSRSNPWTRDLEVRLGLAHSPPRARRAACTLLCPLFLHQLHCCFRSDQAWYLGKRRQGETVAMLVQSSCGLGGCSR